MFYSQLTNISPIYTGVTFARKDNKTMTLQGTTALEHRWIFYSVTYFLIGYSCYINRRFFQIICELPFLFKFTLWSGIKKGKTKNENDKLMWKTGRGTQMIVLFLQIIKQVKSGLVSDRLQRGSWKFEMRKK